MPPNVVRWVLDGLDISMIKTPTIISTREITIKAAAALAWGAPVATHSGESAAQLSEMLGVKWDTISSPASVRLESGDRALVGQQSGTSIKWISVVVT